MSIVESKYGHTFPFAELQAPFLPGHSHRQEARILDSEDYRVAEPIHRRQALERLEHLDDRALRDIGLWREPGSRADEWWMNPPP